MCAKVPTFSTKRLFTPLFFKSTTSVEEEQKHKMIPALPADISKIATPLISFCGDSNLSLVLADRYFRGGPSNYSIEILEDADLCKQTETPEIASAGKKSWMMQSSWYEKHTHRQPALCIFCIPVDLRMISTDCQEWKKKIAEQYLRVKTHYQKRLPSFIAIFVCPDNRDELSSGPIREDQLIRESKC